MSTFPSHYLKLEKIGSGTYGTVYKARDKERGKFMALKKINIENQDDGIPPSAIREIGLLMEFREENHQNIIYLKEVIHHTYDLYLVFEFCEWDLKKFNQAYFQKYRNKKSLPIPLVKSIGKQIMCGVAYCHTRLVVHRDLKPSNILLTKEGVVKLADFGLARTTSLPRRTYCHEIVTLWYRSPEVMLGSPIYGPSVDVWSVACILVEMFVGEVLFPGDSEIDQILRIFNRFGTPTETEWPALTSMQDYKHNFPKFRSRGFDGLDIPNDLQEFFKGMFQYNTEERLTMKKATRNPIFAEAILLPLPPLL